MRNASRHILPISVRRLDFLKCYTPKMSLDSMALRSSGGTVPQPPNVNNAVSFPKELV